MADPDNIPGEAPGPSDTPVEPAIPSNHGPGAVDGRPVERGRGHQTARARRALELVLATSNPDDPRPEPDPPLARFVAAFLESLCGFGPASSPGPGVGQTDEDIERMARLAAYEAHFDLSFRNLAGAPLTAEEVIDLGGPLNTIDAVRRADTAGDVVGFDRGPLRRYPASQFLDGRPVPDLAPVLEHFRRQARQATERSVIVWLLSPNELLAEDTPIRRLRSDGHAGERVLEAAFRRAATWAR